MRKVTLNLNAYTVKRFFKIKAVIVDIKRGVTRKMFLLSVLPAIKSSTARTLGYAILRTAHQNLLLTFVIYAQNHLTRGGY